MEYPNVVEIIKGLAKVPDAFDVSLVPKAEY
jgi:hypothetical protein